MSLDIICPRDLVAAAPVKLTEGTQVIVRGKPSFYTVRGSFSLRVNAIRAVGLGELLARIERLRRLLEAEGLFDPRLKRPLPFLPSTIGLITGRASAAEHDVTTVAGQRWPAVRFAIRNTAVQGANAVTQIVAALAELDADPEVDVIVIARGGGSVEDLLPFSDETLCRAIAACTTPVVSAIGHEPDNPVCDLVADVRAATPTDAAKRVVPDATAELALVGELRHRSAQALRNWVVREQRTLAHLRSRPVLADPLRAVAERAEVVHRARAAVRRDINRLVAAESDRIGHLAARLATLGPAATWPAATPWCRRSTAAPPCCARWPTRRPEPGCASGSPTARSAPPVPARRMESHDRTRCTHPRQRTRLRAVPRRAHRGGPRSRAGRVEPRRVAQAVGAR